MSYWVSLVDTSENPDVEEAPYVTVEPHEESGTFAMGGTNEASLNVTYNYSEVFGLVTVTGGRPFSLKLLHGMTGFGSLSLLERVCSVLPDRPYHADYWAPTPGNAGHAAAVLLSWANQHPDATWRVH